MKRVSASIFTSVLMLIRASVLGGFLTACASSSPQKQANIDHDELFHRAAQHHQSLLSNMHQASGVEVSYETASFIVNRHHMKEAQRVLRCAKAQDGYESNAIYQRPPRYELHYYFLGDAKRKLSSCTHDPLFIAHSVKYSQAQLLEVQKQAGTLLMAQNIGFRSEIKRAGHLLFESKPYSSSILSKEPHVQIFVPEENLAAVKTILSPLMRRYEFLFVTEGQLLDEVFVDELLP